MRINGLIAKHGEKISHNGTVIFGYVDDDRLSGYKKLRGNKEHTSYAALMILVLSKVDIDDSFEVQGKAYRVFERAEVRIKNEVIYTEVVLFDDDFDREVQLFARSIELSGVNLPSLSEEAYTTAFARIKSVRAEDFLQYLGQTGKTPTHKFTLLYAEGVEKTNIIQWGARKFEVLGVENLNERNRLIILTTIEVLSEEEPQAEETENDPEETQV